MLWDEQIWWIVGADKWKIWRNNIFGFYIEAWNLAYVKTMLIVFFSRMETPRKVTVSATATIFWHDMQKFQETLAGLCLSLVLYWRHSKGSDTILHIFRLSWMAISVITNNRKHPKQMLSQHYERSVFFYNYWWGAWAEKCFNQRWW